MCLLSRAGQRNLSGNVSWLINDSFDKSLLRILDSPLNADSHERNEAGIVERKRKKASLMKLGAEPKSSQDHKTFFSLFVTQMMKRRNGAGGKNK